MMNLILCRVAMALAVSFAATGAFAGDWKISKLSGRAYLVDDVTQAPSAVVEGQSLPAGKTLATGRESQAMLTDGKTHLAVGPMTNLSIAVSGPRTSIRQASGSIGLDVETRGAPHLSVVTPFLAAVVKGTAFSVTVGRDSAEVSVTHGVVGVSDKAGKRADVTAGQSAAAGARGMSVGKAAKSAKTTSLSAAASAARASAAAGEASAGPGKSGTAGAKGKSDGEGEGNSNNGNSGSGNSGSGNSGNGNSGNGNSGSGNSGSGNSGSGNSGSGNSGNGNSGNGNSGSGNSGNGNSGNGGGNGNSGNGGGNGGGRGGGRNR